MDFIEVEIINWSKYNPRSDRKITVWFRFQNDFFLSQDLWGLNDAARLTFLFLLCEASKRQSAAVRLSIDYVCTQRGRNRKQILEDIQCLADRGVVNPPNGGQAPDKVLATRQDKTGQDTTKTECRSGDRRALFLGAWNEKVKSLPRVKVWTDSRDQAAKRIKPEDWPTICEKVEASDFLSGRSGRWTSCSIDWALNPKNATKILEGTYDNREANVLKIDVGDILRGGK